MVPPRLTGHPDFIDTGSTPVAVQVAQSLNIPSGTFTIPDISVTSGGAYLISVGAHTLANVMLTDVTVQHIDVFGNEVYRELYGAVMAGNGFTGTLLLPAPTVLRGNIYGSILRISGQVATAAIINGIFGIAGLLQSNADINVYIVPNNLADPEPKMFNGSAIPGLLGSPTPGGLLIGLDTVAIAASGTLPITPLTPYSGPCILIWDASGAGFVPSNEILDIRGFTVANGAARIYHQKIEATAANIPYQLNVDLPTCLNCIGFANTNAANGVTINVTMIAEKAA